MCNLQIPFIIIGSWMLRKIVAGPKVRTIENGYDLDLTYVTDRVIAMAFPAEGF